MPLLRSAILQTAGFSHAFPTRDVTNEELLLGAGGERLVRVKQVHGARVVVASEAAGQEADALVCREKLVSVGIAVADCVPVLVADEASGDVAAIHAGWRGVVAGVVGAALDRLGGDRWVAAIGPSIGPCCFEVGREVADQVGFVVREEGAKAYVDLRAAVRAELRARGIPDERIEDVPGCTKHEARFHSYRRDGAASGRMVATITARGPRAS